MDVSVNSAFLGSIFCLSNWVLHRAWADDHVMWTFSTLSPAGQYLSIEIVKLSFLGVALALPDFTHLGASPDQQGDLGHLPLLPPRLLDVPLCFYHWTIWWLLCIRLQEGIQDQGFWRYHTWTWWYYGQVWETLNKDNKACINVFVYRFDCQFLMATFVNVYIHSFINLPTPGKIIQQVYLLLPEEQLELFKELETSLLQRGILQPWALLGFLLWAWPQISSWVRSCMLA